MAEENNIANQGEKKIPASSSDNEQPVIQDEKKSDNLIPQSRFNEVIAQNKELQKQIDSKNSKDAEREKVEMEKRGEYKELIEKQKTELKSLKELETLYNEERKARREKLLSQIPEDKREKYAKHPLDFLEDAVELFTPKASGAKVDTSAPLSNLGVTDRKDIFGANSKVSKDDRKKHWSSIVQSFKK